MRIFLAVALYALAALGVTGYAYWAGDTQAAIGAAIIAAINIYLARRVLGNSR